MKRCFYLLLAVFFCSTFSSKANPGDTTWVQANSAQLSWYGNYDTTIAFPSPGTSYRKILMIFTLGKYMCGSGASYCGDWDYTVDNYVMTPRGDTFDLGRLITPYANAGAPHTPWTWQQHYVYDITDYASILHDSATIRIAYTGYTGGFTGNIKFAFIEGTPDRNVVGIGRLWHGYWAYGDTTHHDSNDINVHFPYMNFTAPLGTSSSELKFTVTGHGSDAINCNEFCNHSYYVYLNGTMVDSYAIWRPTCGSNELYPQSGTWLYERANWCPGAIVYSEHHKLPGITAGSATNVDIQFAPYISSGGAGYGAEGALFFYGPMNKRVDASIEQIIAPTTDENHFRENPIAGGPTIHIKNTGSAHIDSVAFQYGIADSAMQYYIWAGSLDSLQETDITLPAALYQLNNIAGTTGTYNYVVKILRVNGTADADSTNNTMASQFKAAPLWPSTFKIWFKANNESLVHNPSVCETSWVIYDMYGNIVKQRADAPLNTLVVDTVTLPGGYYQFAVYDSSCDGLHWWVFDANPGLGINAGYIMVKQLSGANIPLAGNVYLGTYSNDFGCGFTQSFSTGSLVQTAITRISEENISMDAYPNPAQDMVNVELSGMQNISGTMQLIDALGRVVFSAKCNSALEQIHTGNLPNGVYTITFIDEMRQNNRLTTRLLIAK